MAGLNITTLDTRTAAGYNLPTSWQLLVIGAIFIWLIFAQLTAFTKHLRAAVQPFVRRHVENGVPVVLGIQRYTHPQLDFFLGSIAALVSVEFYSLVLPLLFWFGHVKLARQLTLLMAICIYVGNSVKDLVCAPRPPSPPVRRVTSSESEVKGSQEYGLPSSHSINTICFTGYLIHHLFGQQLELSTLGTAVALLCAITVSVIFGRVYLGMHSPIDVLAGCTIGASLLLGWCIFDEYLDAFIINGKNVISFWAAIAVLALYAYPTPESPTPSFGFHTAFNGVAFGIVSGVHRTFPLFHSGIALNVPLTPASIVLKTALGIAIIFAVKEVSKLLAIFLLPSVCYLAELLLGFRFRSSSYVLSMRKEVQDDMKSLVDSRKFGSVLKPFYSDDEPMDVDTGIRLVQYAALGWAVVELVPHVFSILAL